MIYLKKFIPSFVYSFGLSYLTNFRSFYLWVSTWWLSLTFFHPSVYTANIYFQVLHLERVSTECQILPGVFPENTLTFIIPGVLIFGFGFKYFIRPIVGDTQRLSSRRGFSVSWSRGHHGQWHSIVNDSVIIFLHW